MKNILLIGGSYGIGLAIAQELHNENNIFVASRSNENLAGLNVTHIPFDASTDTLDTSKLPVVIDGLVYCPGTINLKPFHRFSVEDFQRDYEVNVLGAVKVLQACLKGLKKSESASVVLFSTVAVQVGLGFHASISSAKGAVEGLAKSLAAEWAPNKIRVNVVAPSLTDTPLASALLGNEDKKEASNKRHPLGRYGQPEDIAGAAVFLLSKDASWMTGQVLHLDGGMSSVKSM